jgi:hypothetical protein
MDNISNSIARLELAQIDWLDRYRKNAEAGEDIHFMTRRQLSPGTLL